MKLFVQAKPNSRQENVEKVNDTHFIVSVVEPPREGKANMAIMRVLASYFNVPQSSVFIVSGVTSKQKIVEIVQK